MAQELHAARMGDPIAHPSLAAEMASAIAEVAVYAAATAAVAAVITATVLTGGTAGVLVGVVAGAAVGAASNIPVGEDQSIGSAVSGFCDSLGDSLFPPEVCGKIETGSPNVFINGKPAARAAGSSGPVEAGAGDEAEPSILDTVGSLAMIAVPFILPVVGLGMAINDIFNPPITTPAAPGSQPKSQDTVTCSRHPPMPLAYLAQGSDKVEINSQPAARAGDKTTCDAAIGSNVVVSPNVVIGGKPVTVRDIRNGKSKIAMFTGLLGGMLLARRIRLRPRPPKSPKPQPLTCGLVGNPVAVTTGAKLLGGPQETDFTLPGLIGIEWARYYDSNDTRREGLFGQGWSVPYEVAIERVAHPQGGELWIYIDEEGNRIELGQLQTGNAFVSVLDGLAFYVLADGQTVVEDIYEGRYQVFQTDPGNPQRSRLIRVGDRNVNAVELVYDAEGRLGLLHDRFGRTVVSLSRPSNALKPWPATATPRAANFRKCWMPRVRWSATSPTPPRAT